MDTEMFLCRINKSDDILRRLNFKYKEGKTYRYFQCGFVKEIYHISERDKCCYMSNAKLYLPQGFQVTHLGGILASASLTAHV